MKKCLLLMLVVLTGIVSSCKYDDDELWGSVDEIADRISALETLTKQKNSDIAALQAILTALENEVAVSEVENLTDGYILHFTDGTTATIKNGVDGKDGADGADGKDGANGEDGKDGADGEDGKDGTNGKDGVDGKDGMDAPSIYIAKENGVYYWTLTVDGKTSWLTDYLGRKLPVAGAAAMDGVDGSDGFNGKDGVAPQLKVENGYWLISTNNGNTWSRIKDENGHDVSAKGEAGNQGIKGINLFEGVVVGTESVVVTDANGESYEFPLLKAITFYSDAAHTLKVDTKNTVLDGTLSANYWFVLNLDKPKYEVVADEGVLVNVDMTKGEVSINITNPTVTEARAVIFFYSGKQTLTAVFKFTMGAWDGKNITQAAYDEATGVYSIVTPAHLAWVAQVVNDGTHSFEGKTIRLMNDMDLNNKPWTPIGTVEYPFKGTFDGNNKTIKNLNAGTSSTYGRALGSRAEGNTVGTGMFGVAENATFENVTISNGQSTGETDGAAGILVGVATGETTVSGVTIENSSATASGSESAAGLLIGKATGNIEVTGVTITSIPTGESSETTINNKVEATYAGGVVGHVAADNVKVEGTTVSGLDLGVNASEGTEAAGGAVLGKVDAATEGASVNVTVTGANVEGVKVAVSGDMTSENAPKVSVGALAGAVGDAANATIDISDNAIKDVKTETSSEETAANINQGTVLGNLNEVIDANPEAGANILNGNTVAEDVEIKNQMKVESLNAMFGALIWDANIVPQYSFDIDGEITENTTLLIPQQGYRGKLNLNFKSLASSASAVFTIQQASGNNAGMEVNLTFNAEKEGQYVAVNMPSATVNVCSGNFATLEAWTAVNTLYLYDGVTVDNLIVHSGNIRIAANAKITGSITNQGSELVYVILEEGATAENNLPAEENIGENIEITTINHTITIENVEFSTALQVILGDMVTINEDGYAVMLEADVKSITELNFNWRANGFTSLKGVEFFENLEELYCNAQGITDVDLSQNKALKVLDLKWNVDLTTLDFSNNPNLESLDCSYCRSLTDINLEGCEKLKYLNVFGASSLSTVDVPNPEALESLQIGYWSNNHVDFYIDLNQFVNLNSLSVQQMPYTSTDFIPAFMKANLVSLSLRYVGIESIDLSQYPNLHTLYLTGNKLTTLDVSVLPKLQTFDCMQNYIGSLDISALSNLINLYAGNQYIDTPLILTLTEDQKKLWNNQWKQVNNGNVLLYDEIINNPSTGTGGNGFGNGGKF